MSQPHHRPKKPCRMPPALPRSASLEQEVDSWFAEILAQAPFAELLMDNAGAPQPGLNIPPEPAATPAPDATDDAGLRIRVLASLLAHEIPVDSLRVIVRLGVVTINGIFSTRHKQELAVRLSSRTCGVREVVDQSTVGQPPIARPVPETARFNRLRQHRIMLGSLAGLLLIGLLFLVRSLEPHDSGMYAVTGAVQIEQGVPSGAFLVLHPVHRHATLKALPRATVGPTGRFEVGTYDRADGAPEGDYVVTIEWRPLVKQGEESIPGPNVLPLEYSKPDTSRLRVRVARGANEVGPLHISSSGNAART